MDTTSPTTPIQIPDSNTTANTTDRIKTITIVHKTGRPRIITDHDEIKDISFENLCKMMNCPNCPSTSIKVVYCKFAKKQINKLIRNTEFSIDSNVKKDKQYGLYEITITRTSKHSENMSLSLFG